MKTALPEIKLNIKNGAVVYSITSGWRADFIGADFPQVVDDELNIHTPINDICIVLSFKCTKGSETVEKDCPLLIKGTYDAAGRKPNVIPEPAQWHGEKGTLKKISTYSCDDVLQNAADDFANELSSVTGRKITKADGSGTVHFAIDDGLAYLGDEGYEIVCTEKSITASAYTATGAVWAGKTICQLMVQGGFP